MVVDIFHSASLLYSLEYLFSAKEKKDWLRQAEALKKFIGSNIEKVQDPGRPELR